MGDQIKIKMQDGFELSAYRSMPLDQSKGVVVVIQEIFGVNGHIREVADGYAAQGYSAIAPALFDRIERDIELGYAQADMGKGIELAFQGLEMAQTMKDLQSVVDYGAAQGAVGVVGYCFGGLLTYLSACQLNGVSAASSYYGGGIAGVLDHQPKCPLIMHFGELDAHIPMTDVEKIKAANPRIPVHVYDADHGFNCDHRASYSEQAAELALQRTLAHFDQHL
ncbi:MAG: dienelactone hydrolase family protein [Pseudomonadales bacterium]|nr:dienelactone hydrolase family protein [Pseudomonadales bacterium]